ncbi:hypothetical protein VD0004_g3810 [Verticillium dahliae]|nr:hypothetical protein VD0004_g3810 [Verticillium dahliae]PNH76886.1 hypothetical protein VD0001_g609 [Verticillium dahliae]
MILGQAAQLAFGQVDAAAAAVAIKLSLPAPHVGLDVCRELRDWEYVARW